MCFVFIWEQTATFATSSINWLVFITQIKSVYSAVRTGALNITWVQSILEQTATCATYSINWLVFITEMKSVYSAVRTGALNITWVQSIWEQKSNLCHLQHKLIGFYKPDEKCLQRGTDWCFKYKLGSIYLRANSDLCHLQHKLICFYNPGEVFTARYGLGL